MTQSSEVESVKEQRFFCPSLVSLVFSDRVKFRSLNVFKRNPMKIPKIA